jgi:hypothetical protein
MVLISTLSPLTCDLTVGDLEDLNSLKKWGKDLVLRSR